MCRIRRRIRRWGNLFKNKKVERCGSEFDNSENADLNISIREENQCSYSDEMMVLLIRLSQVIDEWLVEYHLEKLPKK